MCLRNPTGLFHVAGSAWFPSVTLLREAGAISPTATLSACVTRRSSSSLEEIGCYSSRVARELPVSCLGTSLSSS